jgi:hypothetical protein
MPRYEVILVAVHIENIITVEDLSIYVHEVLAMSSWLTHIYMSQRQVLKK